VFEVDDGPDRPSRSEDVRGHRVRHADARPAPTAVRPERNALDSVLRRWRFDELRYEDEEIRNVSIAAPGTERVRNSLRAQSASDDGRRVDHRQQQRSRAALHAGDEEIRRVPFAHASDVPARPRVHRGRQDLLEQRQPAGIRTRRPRTRLHLHRSRRWRSGPRCHPGRAETLRAAGELTENRAMPYKLLRLLALSVATTAVI